MKFIQHNNNWEKENNTHIQHSNSLSLNLALTKPHSKLIFLENEDLDGKIGKIGKKTWNNI